MAALTIERMGRRAHARHRWCRFHRCRLRAPDPARAPPRRGLRGGRLLRARPVRAVILGADGQLGRELRRVLPAATALSRRDLDIADPAAIRARDWSGVDVVLNAAAWTAVDAAEDPANLAAVRAANVEAVATLAELSEKHGFVLVHVSSEYVFDGSHARPIPEDLPFSPLSVYGRSKADGDRQVMAVDRHYLVRTTWVVGEGRNFVATMADLADRGVSPAVVDDQIGRPTSTVDLAGGIRHLLESRSPFGTYNLDRKSTRLNSSHANISYAVFCLKKKINPMSTVTTGNLVWALQYHFRLDPPFPLDVEPLFQPRLALTIHLVPYPLSHLDLRL